MAATGTTHFTSPVLAVCEPANRLTSQDILSLHLEAQQAASAPVVFTFRADTISSTTAPSLQIPADRISSLIRTQCKHDDVSDSPAYIGLVRLRLGSPRVILSRFQFRLRAHGELVDAAGSAPRPHDSSTPVIDAVSLLARASVFSLYMPHEAFPKAKYNIFFQTLRPYLDANPVNHSELAPVAHTQTCYPEGRDAASSAPPGTESAIEVATSLPPEYIDREGGDLSPRPESEQETVAVTTPSEFGPPADDHLPGYYDSGGQLTPTPDPHKKRQDRRSSEKTTSSRRRPTKRGRWSPAATVLFDTESLSHSQSPPIQIGDPHCLQDIFRRLEQLKTENRLLASRNKLLEQRVEEVDDRVAELKGMEERVGLLEEDNEILEIRNKELDEKCDELEKALDEVRNTSGDSFNEKVEMLVGDRVNEYLEKYLDGKTLRVTVE